MSWNNNGPWGPYGEKPVEKTASGKDKPQLAKPASPTPLVSNSPEPDFDALIHRSLENFRRWHQKHNELPHILIGVVMLLIVILFVLSFIQYN